VNEAEQVHTLLALKQYPEAVQAALDALQRSPGNADLHVILAGALLVQGELKGSRAAALSALSLVPEHTYAMRLLGHIELQEGHRRKAMKLFGQAVALAPEAIAFIDRAYGARVVAWHSSFLRRKYFDLAESNLRKAVALEPHNADGHVARAELALDRKRAAMAFDGDQIGVALDAANRALSLDPQNSQAHLVAARASEASGSYQSAASHLVSAGRADPTSSSAMKLLKKLGPADEGGIPPGLVLTVPAIFIAFAASPWLGATVAFLVCASWLGWRYGVDSHQRTVNERLPPEALSALAAEKASRPRWMGWRR